MNNLQPTVLEVQCRCGKMINIRTKQPVKTVSCWVSRHVLEAHLGGGTNNVSVFVSNPDGSGREEANFTVVAQGNK